MGKGGGGRTLQLTRSAQTHVPVFYTGYCIWEADEEEMYDDGEEQQERGF